MLKVPTLQRVRQEDLQFKGCPSCRVNLDCVSPCLEQFKMSSVSQAMVTHAFNPSIQEQRQVDLYKFEVCLFYRASSHPTRTTVQTSVPKDWLKSTLQRVFHPQPLPLFLISNFWFRNFKSFKFSLLEDWCHPVLWSKELLLLFKIENWSHCGLCGLQIWRLPQPQPPKCWDSRCEQDTGQSFNMKY